MCCQNRIPLSLNSSAVLQGARNNLCYSGAQQLCATNSSVYTTDTSQTHEPYTENALLSWQDVQSEMG
jgi:hypothetical protein